ncbi:hypothetical protein D9Q98_007332 [Chlorella vulgaris]|uniref:RING-type domain-containing protein n=1 Tax=Chlorella vulgaris TaxID=3077 RepID=A0A9D4TL88_CHLVU|nr:hypothetical protein D9Q98_007332 [Chlorella vulgaris]
MNGGGEGEASLCCNGCWNACDPKDHSVATKCGHLYCLTCCQTILESDDPTCPICTQLIQKTNIKAVHVLSGTADLQLVLAGQSPQVALEVAHNAIQFYTKQQALYAQYAQAQSQRKIARTHDQCKKKLQEVHAGYLNAKRKYQEVLAQKAALEEGNKELQEKYNQKAMQDRKLKEGFAMIQKENEQLRRHIGVPAGGGGLSGGSGGGGGGGLAGMAGMAGASGGRNSGRAALGMDGGLGGRPGTALGVRLVAPDPSPVPSIGLGTFGQAGGFAYETPDAMPLQPRQLMTHSGGGGRVSSGGRHMSGGGGGGLGGAGGGLGGGLNLGGGMVGQRQALQNDKRQSLGLAFPGSNHSVGTMGTM